MIFEVFRVVKGQKIVQNEKNLCLSYSISQDPYIIWLSFMVHLCKIMISPYVFFTFFSNFNFWHQWCKKGKKRLKMAIMSVTLHISGSIHYMIMIFGTHVQNDDFSRCFCHFFKVLIFCVGRGVKGQKMVQND